MATSQPERAVIGIVPHTGWAIAVVVAGPAEGPRLVARHRLDLTDPTLPRQPYHAAREAATAAEAGRVVTSVAAAAHDCAVMELDRMAADAAVALGAVAVAGKDHAVPADLGEILGSHLLVHAAEGQLYQRAVQEAAAARELGVLVVDADEVHDRLAGALDLTAEHAARRVAALGRGLGPPWRADHKVASAAAWLALLEPPPVPPPPEPPPRTPRPDPLDVL